MPIEKMPQRKILCGILIMEEILSRTSESTFDLFLQVFSEFFEIHSGGHIQVQGGDGDHFFHPQHIDIRAFGFLVNGAIVLVADRSAHIP